MSDLILSSPPAPIPDGFAGQFGDRPMVFVLSAQISGIADLAGAITVDGMRTLFQLYRSTSIYPRIDLEGG